ncbi:putative retrotransposon hot spot (RHS) protein [Trypanosoma cruzi]|nr:putative retrotransposon hot spot (RHS) protein [Trypanosoma cruzi]
MKFTISTNIEDVLFKGRVRVNEMKLSDFLTRELDGMGIVDTNRDVLLEEFFKDPTKYIRDKGALDEIQASGHYLSMKRAVKGEVIFDEDIRKLRDKGVSNPPGWSLAAANVKTTVHNFTKRLLDAALEEVRNPMRMSAAMKLEGLYESVYNARWSHVVEFPDSKKTKKGTGMGVHEGRPEQSWRYNEVGETFERNDAVQKSGEAPPRLMVLTSDKGWPYSWHMTQDSSKDFFVNCEVERVWRIVRNDLTKWLSNSDLTLSSSPVRRVLIGTPGIGKSVAVGSYLLYQLLHCDVEELQVVVHCFGDTAYVFDKTAKTVTIYIGNKTSKIVLGGLRQRGMKGYIIYDVAKKGTPPETGFAPSTGWGMIVVSSPKVSNYDEWEKQLKARRIIMNCPDDMDVEAMCTWMKRGLDPDEQAEYWKKVEEHMYLLGPIPRHIFDVDEYRKRTQDVMRALEWINIGDQGNYFTLGGSKLWYSEDPSHKLVKIVRARTEKGVEVFLNALICADIGSRTADCLAKAMATKDILLLILGSQGALASRALKQLGLRAFMYGEFVGALVKGLNELRSPKSGETQKLVLNVNHQGYPTRTVGLAGLQGGVTRIPMEYGVLYILAVENFPLVDAFFFFVNSNPEALVGCGFLRRVGTTPPPAP